MRKLNIIFWILGIAISVCLFSIGIFYLNISKEPPQKNLTNNSTTQIANPASVNCINIGGELEIRGDEEGNQYGICLKDGKECEEWALFR